MTVPGMARGMDYDEWLDSKKKRTRLDSKKKRTSDDIMTPEANYEAVKNWAIDRFGLEGKRIVRPFWPGADYTTEEYDDDTIVIDNPPYSIERQIIRWYCQHNVRFFLYCNGLTAIHCYTTKSETLPVGLVLVKDSIAFNESMVNVGFVTNLLEPGQLLLSGTLNDAISKSQKRMNRGKKRSYPEHIYTAAALGKLGRDGIDTMVQMNKYVTHTPDGRHIYGGGIRIDDDRELKRLMTHEAHNRGRRNRAEDPDREGADGRIPEDRLQEREDLHPLLLR